MKRTAIKRGQSQLRRSSALRSGSTLRRGKALPRKRARPRRGPIVNQSYRAWVATLACSACPARPAGVAHHNTHGRGAGQKVSDYECMPLCQRCHDDFHAGRGMFKGWEREARRAWQRGHVDRTQQLAGRRFDQHATTRNVHIRKRRSEHAGGGEGDV